MYMWNKLQKLPSFVWVIILPLGLILFIGSIITGFYAIAAIEGVASFIMVGVGILSVLGGISRSSEKSSPGSGLVIGMAITFYALMGMAIDQTGNFIFNKPLQLFCPTQTELHRGVNVSHPLPERTDITQNFVCLDQSGKVAGRVDMLKVIGVRFVEYVIIAYVLVGIRKIWPRKNEAMVN
jgi:hypothetical protein